MSREVGLRVLDGSAQGVSEELVSGVEWEAGYSGAEVARLLDTFDWRLARSGLRLQVLETPGSYRLLRLRTEEAVLEVPWGSRPVPGLAGSLPEGVIGARIAAEIGPRRVLERARIERAVSRRRVLNSEGKTVVRVVAERDATVSGPGTERAKLSDIVRVVGVTGYDSALEDLVAVALGLGAVAEVADDDLSRAIEALRLDTSCARRPTKELDPAWPADRALKSILRELLKTMDATVAGVRQDLDSEFLHDFRVAVRRTRAALGQLKGVLEPAAVKRFTREFRWLGEITGPTRDLDVYLLKIPAYREDLPSAHAEALGGLELHLRQRQRESQRRLAELLAGDRYTNLVREWRLYLEGKPEEELPEVGSVPAVLEVADLRIRKALDKVLRDGRKIDAATPTEALHRLRIDCKKLRYLLEFFRSLYPAKPIGRFIRSLKKLQDNLGDLNDYSVQQEQLGAFAEEMVEAGETTAETLLAMGRLQARLEEGEAEERRRFHPCFAEFAAPKKLSRVERLLHSPRGRRR